MLGSLNVFSQIGIGTTTPAPSAALEVSSIANNKGILIPRISATQKDAIVNPAEGLLIYQTTVPIGFYYYAGTSWKWIANATDLASVGNAATATKLATARNINGVAFDGSTDITAPADAATLTGTALNSTVIGSSLTSVGTLGNLTVTNAIAGSVTGNAATATKLAASKNINGVAFDGSADITAPADAATLTGTALNSTVIGSSLTSVGTLGNLTVINPIAGSVTGTASNVTGIVAIANGGTNSTAVATAGGIGYGTGTAHAYTGAGTTGQILSSTGAGVPTWVTPSGVSVPYSGAIAAVDLGAFDLKVNSLTVGKGGGNIGSNTANGVSVLAANISGTNNTALGYSALSANQLGKENTANGSFALASNIGSAGGFGNGNTAMGYSALRKNTSGYSNTAIGNNALFANTEGYNNTATGANALTANTIGYFNTATGINALGSNTTGKENTAVGLFALGANLSGTINTAMGQGALRYNTVGSYNTAVGYNALNLTDPTTALTGSNTAIGYSAGSINKTGTFNTFIGFGANASSATLTNATAIGNGASVTADNTITLGNSAIATLRAQVTSITALSDRRDKTDITTISEGLDFLKQLKPVSFTWNTRDKAKVGIKSAGFIAQDLLALQQKSAIGANLDLVSQENPDKLEARYSNLLPVIIKAIQEESAQKDSEIAALKVLYEAQQKQIEELKLLILSMKK